MAIALKVPEGDKVQSPAQEVDGGDHCGDRCQGEDQGGSGRQLPVVLHRRKEKQRDESLTGPEDKDDKEAPCGGGAGPAGMGVDMLPAVCVEMPVDSAIGMGMEVRMRMAPPEAFDGPDKIERPHDREEPGGDIPPGGLDRLHSSQTPSDPQADRPEKKRSCHMSDPTEKGDRGGAAVRPVAGFREGHEGKVVIRTHQGMCYPDHCGGKEEGA